MKDEKQEHGKRPTESDAEYEERCRREARLPIDYARIYGKWNAVARTVRGPLRGRLDTGDE